jgi:hypothetical protein
LLLPNFFYVRKSLVLAHFSSPTKGVQGGSMALSRVYRIKLALHGAQERPQLE